MWKEGELEDDKICIKIKKKQFLCNRTTLSLHSSYFEAMFRGNFIEKDKKVIILKVNKIKLSKEHFCLVKKINNNSVILLIS